MIYVRVVLSSFLNINVIACFFAVSGYMRVATWKYNIRRNGNSDFSIATMRRVAITFFELGVVKNLMQTFNGKRLNDYFLFINCV